MKVKILVISAIFAALVFLAGAGTALAGGRDRADYYRHHRQPAVVHPVQHRVVHRQPKMAYGRIIPVYHHPAYVHHRPMVVRHAPVCAPVHAGWGLTFHFGW